MEVKEVPLDRLGTVMQGQMTGIVTSDKIVMQDRNCRRLGICTNRMLTAKQNMRVESKRILKYHKVTFGFQKEEEMCTSLFDMKTKIVHLEIC